MMNFHHASADCFVPDGTSLHAALARTTHLGIGAHQDDLEIMAFHGIAACFHSRQHWFTGITCTDGGGSARIGAYRDYSAQALQRVRQMEQRSAATVGRYGAMVQLNYESDAIRKGFHPPLLDDIRQLLQAASPEIIYTHSLADRHATHTAVALHLVRALRELPEAQQPRSVYGCEVWGSLDWLAKDDKVTLEVSGQDHLASSLIGLYDSQIGAAKRYDLATLGRWRSNATYRESHGKADAEHVILAMDLKPLVLAEPLDPMAFLSGLFDRAKNEVKTMLAHQLRSAT